MIVSEAFGQLLVTENKYNQNTDADTSESSKTLFFSSSQAKLFQKSQSLKISISSFQLIQFFLDFSNYIFGQLHRINYS